MGKGLVKIDMDMQDLEEQLCAYANTDYYPFHMPGHKRVELSQQNPYGIDITEIEGFDNLHAAHGILQQSQERLRKLYNSKKAYYLVNGSTCGILSAAGASAKQGNVSLWRGIAINPFTMQSSYLDSKRNLFTRSSCLVVYKGWSIHMI